MFSNSYKFTREVRVFRLTNVEHMKQTQIEFSSRKMPLNCGLRKTQHTATHLHTHLERDSPTITSVKRAK